MIAGPIVRYKDIASEIDDRRVTIEDFSYGIERFIIGLGKKAIIANSMASMVDSIWNNGATENTWIIAWIGSIGYTLQIYFDFSGYSDMAIGLGRMFGFHFNENFNMPYISKNISEFWRRLSGTDCRIEMESECTDCNAADERAMCLLLKMKLNRY